MDYSKSSIKFISKGKLPRTCSIAKKSGVARGPSFNPASASTSTDDGANWCARDTRRQWEGMGGGVQGFVGPTAVCGCVYMCVFLMGYFGTGFKCLVAS